MTERGIMVDSKELYKLGPVDGAFSMFADLLSDILVEDDLSSKKQGKELSRN